MTFVLASRLSLLTLLFLFYCMYRLVMVSVLVGFSLPVYTRKNDFYCHIPDYCKLFDGEGGLCTAVVVVDGLSALHIHIVVGLGHVDIVCIAGRILLHNRLIHGLCFGLTEVLDMITGAYPAF